MAKQYQVTSSVKIVNRIMRFLIRLGWMPKGMHILTVEGRKTGKLYTTPVTLVIDGNRRWLVAPYGEVGWVRNARAAGKVTFARGGKTEMVAISEVEPEESAPVLKAYISIEKITRPYFDVEPDAPLADFIAEAPRHPVFLIGDPV